MLTLAWSVLGVFAGVVVRRLVDAWMRHAAVRGTRIGAAWTATAVGLSWAVLAWQFAAWADLLVTSGYVVALLLLALIDWEHQVVPNALVVPLTVAALLASFVVTPLENVPLNALLGALAASAFMTLLFAAGRRTFGPAALGLGDVKLVTAIGAALGLHRVFWALALGMLLAGGYGLWLAQRGAARGTTLPYGAFLALAAVLALLFA